MNNKQIIKCLDSSKYLSTFTSSLMFPFVNRIKDGKYKFEGSQQQLKVNFPDENNAIHGLVYYQEFEFVEKEEHADYAQVTLKYSEVSKPQGFPFNYTIYITYKLTSSSLEVTVEIVNTDAVSFPFSIGWHPYFYSSNLYNSYFKMDSSTKYALNERNIPIKELPYKFPQDFQIKDNMIALF